MGWLTAWGGLVKNGELRRGDTVLLTAAASSVGLAAIQTANAAGALSIATTRTAAKRDALLRAGAAHVIVTAEEDVPERVLAITGGRGADVVFDAIAGSQVEVLARAMAVGGRLVLYGYLGGLQTPLPFIPMLRKALTVRAHSIFHTTGDSAILAEAVGHVMEGVQRGVFSPVVDRTFPLAEIVDAHRYLDGSEQVGKIVVLPEGQTATSS
jgi:NADPH:quinone reductase-like Zn-dependent oxidoreductase